MRNGENSNFKDFKSNKLKNIFIITIDALRADHIGCLGYKKKITPNIDKLAKDGVLFKNAIASGSYTFISFPSIVSNQYATEYYIKNSGIPTITKELKKYGYKTISFNSNPHARGKLDKDFDYFDDLLVYSDFDRPLEKFKRQLIKKIGKKNLFIRYLRKILIKTSANIVKPYTTAGKMNQKVIEYLEKNINEPLFFWIHYMDPHYPYLPPRDFTNISKSEIIKLNRKCRTYLLKNRLGDNVNIDVNKYDVEKLIELYDGEIKYVDQQIGFFIDYLKKMDLYDNSLILLFSDHGEMFGEHGRFAHEYYNLYQQQLHIPLIIKAEEKNKVIDKSVTIMDIPKTITEIIDVDSSVFSGYNLLNSNRDYIISEGFKPQDVFLDSDFNIDKISFSCQKDKWKLVYNQIEKRKELYNLDNDPYENNNILNDEYEIAENIFNIILEHKKRLNKTQDVKINLKKVIKRIEI